MTNQELTDLITFHRTLSEKCARSGSNATLAFSEAANECERYRYRARHFLICNEHLKSTVQDTQIVGNQ